MTANETFILGMALNSVTYAALLFLVSSGFTLIFGLLRVLNLAHGSFYLWGAYLAVVVSAAPWGNIFIALVVSGLTVGCVGLLIERGLFRFVQGDLVAEVLLTIGLSLVLADVALMTFGGNPESVTLPSYLNKSVAIAGLPFPAIRLFVLGLAALVLTLMVLVLGRTRLGALVRAAVDDAEMLSALGVNAKILYAGVFVFASVLAGVAGAAGGGFLNAAPGVDSQMLLLALVVVVIGGLGSLWGAVIGSLIVSIIVNFGTVLTPQLVYFLVFLPMLVVLVMRPRGLTGGRT